jgi:hypothetical protein
VNEQADEITVMAQTEINLLAKIAFNTKLTTYLIAAVLGVLAADPVGHAIGLLVTR